MATWVDEYATMLDDCENRQSRMTDWEIAFVASLQEQLADGRQLSEKQVRRLDELWERLTARG